VSADSTVLAVPFAGERYATTAQLSALIAPPYDVIAPEQRVRYAAQDPHNIVHVMLPEAPSHAPGQDRYASAAALLTSWRAEGVLVRDSGPTAYVLAQDFALPSGERRTRVGVFLAVSAEAYTNRRIRPHERTHSAPKADRLALLRATDTNLESIFLLAPDDDRRLADALAQVADQPPMARAELDGVQLRMWQVTGETAAGIGSLASRGPLYIADGHHRFETAAAYAAQQRPQVPGAARVLALIVSTQDPGLVILPTHRIVFAGGIEEGKLLESWRHWFDVGRVAPCADRVERLADIGRDRTACLVALPNGSDLTLVLKREAPLDKVPGLGKSAAARTLDVARIETLVVQAILGASSTTPSLAYTPDPYAAFDAVRKGAAAAAVLLNPTRVDQVLAVADANDIMPPKSTYFIPKVPSGLVLRSLREGPEG